MNVFVLDYWCKTTDQLVNSRLVKSMNDIKINKRNHLLYQQVLQS